MGITSLQVCMDSSDWLQGVINEESGLDTSSPSAEDMLTCSRPLIERRLRPQQDQALKCPRCDSTHTKFCYYNNYSLSQPRYFCKTCRRYWTKGGTLRNIPVGGGCRKNKKVAPKKSNETTLNQNINHGMISSSSSSSPSLSHHTPTDLQLSFPADMQLSHLTNILGSQSFMDNPRPIDFMESKFEALVGNSNRSHHDFMGGCHDQHLGLVGGLSDVGHGFGPNFHGLCSPFGMGLDGNGTGAFLDTCQRLMLPYEGYEDHSAIEVKPTGKLLSLDWQDQGCSDAGKDSFGVGSWTGMMNPYGPSTTNPLV